MCDWNLFSWIRHYILLFCNAVNFSFLSPAKTQSNNTLVVNFAISKIPPVFGEHFQWCAGPNSP